MVKPSPIRLKPSPATILLPLLVALASLTLGAQRGGMFQGSADDPAIAYSTAPLSNALVDLTTRLESGAATLAFDGRSGYLTSLLDALGLPLDSQMLVFSKTSLQQKRISETNPRAIFFNDRVALGWVRDGELIEVAAHDAREGIAFYTLEQKAVDRPTFRRAFNCLACHKTGDTLGVPGLLMFSTTATAGGAMWSSIIDQRSPIERRWGGWFVTGSSGAATHAGNQADAVHTAARETLSTTGGLFDADGYVSLASDLAALMVFSHQTQMTNLLTRVGWEARIADPAGRMPLANATDESARVGQMMDAIAREVVDYLLFIDEAPLPDRLRGSTGFAARFSTIGPRDSKGRSLHELDLTARLMKYPCSYLIYSAAFDALPAAAKDPIYRRMWAVLSGEERGERYGRALSQADRQAIVEILRETKADLPAYFLPISR